MCWLKLVVVGVVEVVDDGVFLVLWCKCVVTINNEVGGLLLSVELKVAWISTIVWFHTRIVCPDTADYVLCADGVPYTVQVNRWITAVKLKVHQLSF